MNAEQLAEQQLRDRIAMQAMQVLLHESLQGFEDIDAEARMAIAARAYQMADAMLLVRNLKR